MENKTMLQKIRSVKLCLMAHPDNEPNSEFEDRISDLEEIEATQQVSDLGAVSGIFDYGFIEWIGKYHLKIIRVNGSTIWNSGSKYWRFNSIDEMTIQISKLKEVNKHIWFDIDELNNIINRSPMMISSELTVDKIKK
jgi:hypothetical protein